MANPTSDRSTRVFGLSCRTDSAYMYPFYGEERWCENIGELVGAGYTNDAIEWIVRSKIARWADDEGISMLAYINKFIGDARLRIWMNDPFVLQP